MEGIGAAETCCMLEGKGIGRLVSNPANSFASMLVEFCCKRKNAFFSLVKQYFSLELWF
jgi:hypothetical protein